MAKTRPGKRDVDSYTIRGTNKVVKAGDCVLMRPSEHNSAPYVGLVKKIEADNRNNVRVKVRWYYRPEEAVGGRRQFHGAKELFLSDHYDIQSAHTIEGKCIVHTFKNYTRLENVGPEDYYCRFEYKPASGTFLPDRVAVYCKCEMPYNPDDLMIQCEECKDWYHPACVELTIEQAKQLDHFVCSDHDKDMKRPHKIPLANGKLDHFVCSEHDEDMKKPHKTPLANGKLDHFVCSEHDEDMKKPHKTPLANGKLDHFVCSEHDEDMKKPHKTPLANGKLDHFVCSEHDEDMKKPTHKTPLANGKLDHFVCSEHDEDMKKPHKTPFANGKLDHFVCSGHDEDMKKPHKTPLANGKAEPKRQKK